MDEKRTQANQKMRKVEVMRKVKMILHQHQRKVELLYGKRKNQAQNLMISVQGMILILIHIKVGKASRVSGVEEEEGQEGGVEEVVVGVEQDQKLSLKVSNQRKKVKMSHLLKNNQQRKIERKNQSQNLVLGHNQRMNQNLKMVRKQRILTVKNQKLRLQKRNLKSQNPQLLQEEKEEEEAVEEAIILSLQNHLIGEEAQEFKF